MINGHRKDANTHVKAAKTAYDNAFSQYELAIQNQNGYSALKEYFIKIKNAASEADNETTAT